MNLQELQQYSEMKPNNVLIPDDVLIRDGISCGDSLIIQASLNDEILDFVYSCEACMQCKAIMGYIYSKYNHTLLKSVISDLGCDYQMANERFEEFCFQLFKKNNLRKECIVKPIEICLKFFTQLGEKKYMIAPLKETKKDLDCDACVSTGRVNWTGVHNETASCQTKKSLETSDYPLDFRSKWMPLGKTYLNEKEIQLLRENVKGITYEDILLFAKLKIDQMIFFNIKKYCEEVYSLSPIWKSVFYRQYRACVVEKEIIRLKAFIKNNELPAYFVKGSFMQKMYNEKTGIRVFLDYDILAMSPKVAFLIATYLFRNNYKIFYSEFSIKHIQSKQGIDVYTGHFHLHKFIYNQYQVIIDINFPGFPMGRISLYYPKRIEENSISKEDEFIITLCHLFKHKDVFMKDLNDLYLLLKTNLDLEYLEIKIRENDLQFFFTIAVKYIVDNYDLDDEIVNKLSSTFDFDNIGIGKWPYDYKQVYRFKREDLNARNENFTDNDRVYLFPLAIFTCCPQISEDMRRKLSEYFNELIRCEEQLYRLTRDNNVYLLCGMGIFWDHSNKMDGVTRKDVEDVVNEIISILHMESNIVHLPYYLQRQGEWF